jgi:hypothetical protein
MAGGAGRNKVKVTEMRISKALCYTSTFVVGIGLLAAGCAKDRPESVPADARSVAKQGGTQPVNFTAPRDGTVYVYDRTSQKMLYSGRVRQGETLELDPMRNKVRLEGRVVMEKNLRDLNQYQVWFDEEGGTQAAAPVVAPAAAPRTDRPAAPASEREAAPSGAPAAPTSK